MNILDQPVLVLNKSWQAIDITTVAIAYCDLCRGVATGMDTASMSPVTWEQWRALPIRECDQSVATIHGPVRVPTVICKASYAKMPKKRPKLSSRAIAERDGRICQYTGEHAPDGNVDHVIPSSRGGKTAWENVVWSSKKVNTKKGNRLNHEVGLKLRRQPKAPPVVPFCATVKPHHDDWKLFLIE
jgi:5-methylcytosine-specific restriction endonuclease McrA